MKTLKVVKVLHWIQGVKKWYGTISKVKESRRKIQLEKKSMSSFLDMLKLKETLKNLITQTFE